MPTKKVQSLVERLDFESLEARITLDGNGIADCPFELGNKPTAEASRAVNCFAADFFEHIRQEDGNVFMSPLSLSTALSMTAAGADGNTANQMQDVLYLGEDEDIHASFGALLTSLQTDSRGIDLELANILWPQSEWGAKQGFVDTIQGQYDGDVLPLNFASEPEASRQTINERVADQTRDKVGDLIPEGAIDELTRLVLTNAIYFQADWQMPFSENATVTLPFHREDGVTVDVPTMTSVGIDSFKYTEIDGFQILVLDQGDWHESGFEYTPGSTSMVVLLPADGNTTSDLSPETLAKVDKWLEGPNIFYRNVDVWLPKFKTEVFFDLKTLLGGMGMPDMFDSSVSDFSKITDNSAFHITDVFHKAFVEITETGTEAAAATAVIGGIICFAKGTPVLTPNGAQAIESLTAGDLVLARDEHNLAGPIEPKLIEETFVNETEIVNLRVGGQLIRTTSEHPFFVKSKGWRPAIELAAGDQLAGDLSSWHEVESVEATGEVEKVYNFRVADHHTYFVGSEQWGFSVWTHNRCGGETEFDFRADRPFHFMIRDDVTSSILFMGRISDPLQQSNDLEPKVKEAANVTVEPLVGDANGDDKVDFADFLVFSRNYARAGDVAFADGDFNNDDEINFADFLLLQNNFGTSRGTESPEIG